MPSQELEAQSLSHALAALGSMAIGHGSLTLHGIKIAIPGRVELSIEKIELAARSYS